MKNAVKTIVIFLLKVLYIKKGNQTNSSTPNFQNNIKNHAPVTTNTVQVNINGDNQKNIIPNQSLNQIKNNSIFNLNSNLIGNNSNFKNMMNANKNLNPINRIISKKHEADKKVTINRVFLKLNEEKKRFK